MFHQKRSFYPLVIAILTLALGSLMFFTLSKSATKPSSSDRSTVSPTPSVTDADYRTASHNVVAPFLVAYEASATDGERLASVEDAISALMPLIVPVSYKDVHLGLAVSLTLMRDGLRGDSESLDSGYAKLTGLISDEPWLSP